MNGTACSYPQAFVDQRPAFDRKRKRRVLRENQVMGKSGIIRRDKRKKHKYY